MTTPTDPTRLDTPDMTLELDLDDTTVDESGVRSWLRRQALLLGIAVLLMLFTIVVLWPLMVIPVRSGEEGVYWSRVVGTNIDTVFGEGTHLIAPWDKMFVYDLRISKLDYTVPVLSTDGLEIDVDITARYRPVPRTTPQLHQQVGPDYVERIIVPELVAAVREVMGGYRPEELYSGRTVEMQNQIAARAAFNVRDRFVILDDVLIRRIELPERVQAAIEDKLKQEQASLEYLYRQDREVKEKLRKQTEAEGIATFTRLVKEGANFDEEQYLRWKGIEATLALAQSDNAKVVVVGAQNGLPLILNSN